MLVLCLYEMLVLLQDMIEAVKKIRAFQCTTQY